MFGRLFKRVRLGESKRGFALIIVAFALPVFLAGINWIINMSKKANVDVTKYEIPYVIALEISKHYNPSKSWASQKSYLYSIGARAYNDRYYNIDKSSPFALKSNFLIYSVRKESSCANQTEAFFKLCSNYRDTDSSFLKNDFTRKAEFKDMPAATRLSYNEGENGNNKVYYNQYQLTGEKFAYSMPTFYEDSELMALYFDENNGTLKVECPKLKRQAVAQLSRNDIDIILAIPTNHASGTSNNSNISDLVDISDLAAIESTPIRQIAGACQGFLSELSHIRGIAVGVIPYSGKISLPPNRSGWTIRAKMSETNKKLDKPYVQQIMFYGSDGKFGGELRSDNRNNDDYGTYRYWGEHKDIGLPIMYRRGDIGMIRNMSVCSSCDGASSLLLNMEAPSSDKLKFIQMNPNPCYLGYCNVLAMLCERDCITYKSNPYFIEELSADLPAIVNDLEFYLPVKDDFNKSNFLFLPIVWAGNLLNSWTSHPSLNDNSHPTRDKKQPIVVIIANAPDNFEPVELTYLGFDNDASEIPMYESDTILFDSGGYVKKNGKYLGVKGVINYSTTGTTIIHNELEGSSGSTTEDREFMSNGYGLLYKSKGTATISFPNKGILKIVVSRNEPASVTIQGDRDITQHKNEKINVLGTQSVNFDGPKNFVEAKWSSGYHEYQGNKTTQGPNFGHNLSTNKLKLKTKWCNLISAKLSNQVLRYYGEYDNSECNNKGLITSGEKDLRSRMDPCIVINETDYSIDREDTIKKKGSEHSGYGWKSDYSAIEAYKFSPTCKNISGASRFIMYASYFPNHENLFCRRVPNEAYCSLDNNKYSNDCIGFIFDGTYQAGNSIIQVDKDSKVQNSGKYTVYTAPFGPESIGNLIVSTGKLRYTSQLGRYDTYNNKMIKKYEGQAHSTLYKVYKISPCNEHSCCFKTQKSEVVTLKEAGCRDVKRCCNSSGNEYDDRECWDATTRTDYWNEYNQSVDCVGIKRCFGPETIKDIGELGSNWTEKADNSGCEQLAGCLGECSPISIYSATLSYDETVGGACLYKGFNKAPDCEWKTESGQNKQIVYESYIHDEHDGGYKGPGKVHDVKCDSKPVNDIKNVISKCLTSEPSLDVTYTINKNVGSTGITLAQTSYPARCYDIVSFNSNGAITKHDTEFCDESGRNCSEFQTDKNGNPNRSFSWQNESVTLYPNKGLPDDNHTRWSSHRYTMKNFFFVNPKSIEQPFEYDDNIHKLKTPFDLDAVEANTCIGLDGKEYFSAEDGVVSNAEFDVHFCGDGALSLDFFSYDKISVEFGNINNKVYKLQLNNKEVVDTASNKPNVVSSVQTFYIVPEQINDIKDSDGNYYITMGLGANSRVVSVELNNRIYSDIKPKLECVNYPELNNDKVYVANDKLHFKTNIKSDFEYDIETPNIKLIGETDYRQKAGKITLSSNTKVIPATLIAKIPDEGSRPTFTIDDKNVCTITSNRKLKSVTLSGFKIPSATFAGNSYSWQLSEDDDVDDCKSTGTVGLSSDSSGKKSWNQLNGIIAPKNITKEYSLTLCNAVWKIAPHQIGLYNDNSGVWSDVRTTVSVKRGYFNNSKGGITFNGDKAKIEFKFDDLYEKYKGGTLKVKGSGYYGQGETSPSMKVSVGSSVHNIGGNSGVAWEKTGKVSSQKDAIVVVEETSSRVSGERNCGQNNTNCEHYESGYNYISDITYVPDASLPDAKEISNEKDKGEIYAQGAGTLEYTLTPIKVADSGKISVIDLLQYGMIDYKYSVSPGFYVTEITGHELYYDGGEFGGERKAKGDTIQKSFKADEYRSGKDYRRDIYVKNAEVSIVSSSGATNHTEAKKETIKVSADKLELRDDGCYHVEVQVASSVVANLKWTSLENSDGVRTYAHPNIKKEGLSNTRIFDGYYRNNNTFGSMSYPLASGEWAFKPIQRLFYWLKTSSREQLVDNKKIKGDFYINIWDQDDIVPAIKWYLGDEIQNKDYDDNIFGKYRSNYKFSGLHRMFIPYKAYGIGDMAGFSEAMESAIVFAGFTLPVNYALLQGGYQASSSYPNYSVSPTPTEAIKKLAQDACKQLKSLTPKPIVYLIKYRTTASMSLDTCVDKVFNISSADQLNELLKSLAFTLKSVNFRQLTIKTSKL